VIAVVIIILPWIVINLQLGVYQDKVLPIPEEFIEMMESLISTDSNNPFWILALLFIIALSPAICEEILFRGVITSGLRRVLSGWATVLVVGILFGLFHMSVYRVLSTGLTGILLTYFVVRSGSIFLPMIAHFLNNAVAILIDAKHIPKSWVEYIETSGIDESGFPLTWIAIAVVIFIAGIVMFEMTLPKNRVIPGHDPIDSTTG
jgi:sodium transport system permease protein